MVVGGGEALTGTVTLARLVLRRDRLRIAIWVVALVGLVGVTANSIFDLYPDEAALAEYARTVDANPSLIALSGPAVGLDTFGGRIAWEGWQLSIAVALMGALAVGRHTRAEEEAGRTELVRATVTGRHAHSAAALVVSALSSALVGAGVTLVLLAVGLPGTGAVLMGAGFALLGITFGAVALLTAQVTEHARAATGMAAAVVGVSFVLRAIGDVGDGTLSWASPFGWVQAAQPFSTDRWWPLALPVAATVALVALAVAVEARRDVGAGLVRPRPGPPEAGAALAGARGLAWRLQRGSLLAWSVGVALVGVAMGSVADSADDLVGDNEQIRAYLAQLGGAELSDIFLATVLLVVALLATGFALQATLRPRAEEAAHRAEPVLATATSRRSWLGSHLAVGLGGSAVVLAAGGLGTGVSYAAAVGDAGEVPRLVGAALAFVPAVWVLVGVAVALYGWVPRAAALVWAVLAVAVVVGTLGEGLGLPRAVRALSPFDHLAGVPAVGVAGPATAVLGALAVLLVAAGMVGFERRDIA